jgi:phosphopantothenoylcysteine decarboxylase / phosphopantothenate---cysteine ligase
VLAGRRILVGVSGSIAAYKAAEVVRGLIKLEAEVRVVMTPSATNFVGPPTFAALTGSPVHTDVFAEPHRVIHVELARWAEAYLLCGATASTMARLATGSGEDIVSATYLMARCPVVLAPAMHTEMWEHAAVQRNLATLVDDGVLLVPPGTGDLASGDVGVGRLAEPDDVVEAVRSALTPNDLEGLRVLITAGPTREAVDPVRSISNRSTGRMGFALAVDAARRGAVVTLVAGPTALKAPSAVDVVHVESAEQMLDACLDRFADVDVVVKAAAVADWRSAHVASQKLKKGAGPPGIVLEPTVDIAAELGRKKGAQTLVLFAAETSDEIEAAKEKLERKHADMVVANLVGRPGTGFESETNDASIVTHAGVEQLPRLRKDDLARVIWDRVRDIRNR